MPTDPAWTHLLLFDGVCNLCDQTVQWVLVHDRRNIVKFCSIQSELGSRLYRERGFDPAEPQSMVLITPEGSYAKSDAALQLAKLMGGRLAWLSWARIIPRFARDLAYSFIAKNRYRFFGKKDECWLPKPEWKERFLG
ncbi:MAG: DCC1-like thiol-disulfide oxidoreductase family protein [Verrucomicrobiota bacterium]